MAVEFSGQILLNVRALQRSVPTFVASINANNSFVRRDVGWTQTYSFPEPPLMCFTASGQEQAPPAPLNYLKCCTKGP